jgi:hypothetical protein
MRGRRLILALGLLVLPARARAQFFKVYDWETPPRAWTEPALWTTWVARSGVEYDGFGGEGSREGLWAHRAEVEYGVSDRLAVAAYADLQNSPDDGTLRYTGARIEARYRLFDRYQMLFDPALYLEYSAPRESSGEPQELEGRLILQRDWEDLRLLLNPAVTTALSGDAMRDGLRGALFSGLYYRRFYHVQPGVEYYAEFGPLSSPDSREDQDHRIFPALRIRIGNGFLWDLGVGFGLTRASDDLTVKSILQWELPTLRPSKQAG